MVASPLFAATRRREKKTRSETRRESVSAHFQKDDRGSASSSDSMIGSDGEVRRWKGSTGGKSRRRGGAAGGAGSSTSPPSRNGVEPGRGASNFADAPFASAAPPPPPNRARTRRRNPPRRRRRRRCARREAPDATRSPLRGRSKRHPRRRRGKPPSRRGSRRIFAPRVPRRRKTRTRNPPPPRPGRASADLPGTRSRDRGFSFRVNPCKVHCLFQKKETRFRAPRRRSRRRRPSSAALSARRPGLRLRAGESAPEPSPPPRTFLGRPRRPVAR
mmetsp:Transcript_4191/g.17800  ORF Transcript_4191/g.17800 Transcript_4191/m.17800 type:complete len:274 (+) Transcript_4191:3498-4319(+)